MKDSNSPDHIATCEHCGEQYDLRLLCEVWVHEHTGSEVSIPDDIIGVRVGNLPSLKQALPRILPRDK